MKNYELNALNGSFVPERLHMFLNVDELENYKSFDPEIKKDLVRFHERMHYFQTGMTGYGQSRWQLYRQCTNTALEEWLSATENYKDCRPLPIGYLRFKSRGDFVKALKINLTCVDSLLPFSLQTYASEYPVKVDDLNLPYFKGSCYITPQITVNSEDYCINGIDIVEAHAKSCEALYAFAVYGIPINVTINKERLPKKYYYIWDWFSNLIGADSILDFLTICDLSLQTGKWKLPEGENEWMDQHPGWRFYRLTLALHKEKDLRFTSSEQMIQEFSQHANHLLRKCSYEDLETILERCLERFSYEGHNSELLGIEKRMKEIILFRSKHKWAGAYPLLDMNIWKEINNRFHPLFIQQNDSLEVVPSLNDERPSDLTVSEGVMAESTLELHFQAFVGQVLGRASNYSTDLDEIECGFKYFGINRGCYFQSTAICKGSFLPKEGSPAPFEMIDENNFKGCTFEAFLDIAGVGKAENLDLNFSYAKFPSYEECAIMLKQ